MIRFGRATAEVAAELARSRTPLGVRMAGLQAAADTDLYGYVLNDPINRTDLTGMAPECHTKKECYDAWRFNMMGCNAAPPNLRPVCWAAASALLGACLASSS